MAKKSQKSAVKRQQRRISNEFFETLPLALPSAPPLRLPQPTTSKLVRSSLTAPQFGNLPQPFLPAVGTDIWRICRVGAAALVSRTARRLYYLALVAAVSTACGMGLRFVDATYQQYASYLNNPILLQNNKATGTTILDRNGNVLYQVYGASTKIPVAINQVPQSLVNATLAAEDPGFYQQPAVSIKGTLRAVYQDILHRGAVEGGSTLTQQLVKNTLVSPSGSFLRKAQEVVLASELERRYGKDKIMEMYLNTIYYGQGSYGIGAAAQTYFKTDVSHLTLAQSAMLAGLPLGPSRFDPTQDLALATSRRNYVLGRMADLGYISASQAASAKTQPLVASARQVNIQAPDFVFYVLDQLRTQYGDNQIENGGLTVTTTLDLTKQHLGEQIVSSQIGKLSARHVTDGALISLDPKTGQILSMVGSANYADPNFGAINMTTSPRQPGSSIKPLTYLDAFTKGFTPATVVDDLPVSFPDGTSVYRPMDDDQHWRGKVTLREALANSLNVPAIHVEQHDGIPDLLNFMHNFGITTLNNDPNSYGLSLTLGSGEVKMVDMAAAYGVFANNGKSVTPIAITKVSDRFGRDITKLSPIQGKPLVDPRDVAMLTSILSDNAARSMIFGSNSPLHLDRPAAAKTGTTTDFKDNWTIGYTPDVVAVAWAGNADDSPMGNGVDGITGAAPIWHDYMEAVLSGTPVDNFVTPPGMTAVTICKTDGGLANPWDGGNLVTETIPTEEVPKRQCATSAPAPATPVPVTSVTSPDQPPIAPDAPPAPSFPFYTPPKPARPIGL